MNEDTALLVVDIQNDFCPGGALQIRDGDRVIEPVNRAISIFTAAGLKVFASRDWHPPQSKHFHDFGGPWPVHCVQGTFGAKFHPELRLTDKTVVLSKGIEPELHGYSAFEGVTDDGRNLLTMLEELGITRLYLCGLATDYCVLSTALEALNLRLKVTLLTDAVAGVDIIPDASAEAMRKMVASGAMLTSVDELNSVSV